MKPRVRRVIVVEGRYDKIRLESCLDATIVTTEGFGIFKDKEKRSLLRRLARERGIVILSDPDGAGALIRSHLHTLCGGEGIVDLYVPPILGKERRKSRASRQGLLGVEGISNQVILELFVKSGLFPDAPPAARYTKMDLYRMGYVGQEESARRREAVLERHHLPKHLSSGAFLEIINLLEIEL